MNFLELAAQRQSVRKYEPGRRIPREVLERCLEAARLAPSACNSQPWSFVVADTPETVRALAEAACTQVPYGLNKFARDGAAIVAIVTEKMKLAARLGAQIRGVPYSLVDIGIAGEHLVLQAAEEGLGIFATVDDAARAGGPLAGSQTHPSRRITRGGGA